MPKYSNEQVIQAFRQIPPNNRIIGGLYDEVQQLIKPYLLRNSGTEEDIGDLVNDVFMILANNIIKSDFKFTAAYTTYIYSIAQHKWLQTLAQRKKIPIVEIMTNDDDDDNDHERKMERAMYDNKEEKDAVEEEIAMAEVRLLFHQTLSRYLGELCRTILLLRYVDAYSHKEIQATMGLNTESASKENLSRCSKKLKDKIQNDASYQKFITEHFPFVKRLIVKS